MASKIDGTNARILIYGLLIIAAMIIFPLAGAYALAPDTPPVGRSVPRCTVETGEDQEVCWWEDGPNGVFYNLDHGRVTYVPRTGDVIEWDRPAPFAL